MGANTYLAHAASKGYKAGSTALPITQFIDARPNERIAIRAFGFRTGTAITSVYFMQELGVSTLTTLVASGAQTGLVLDDTLITGNLLGTSDYIALQLDNGIYQVVAVATGASSNFSVADALEDDMAAGNKVHYYGVYGDTDSGHIRFQLALSTADGDVETTKELEGGIMYGNGMGKSMLVYDLNDTVGSPGSMSYLTIDYINV